MTTTPAGPELKDRRVSPAERASVRLVCPSATTISVASANDSSCDVGTGPGTLGPLMMTT